MEGHSDLQGEETGQESLGWGPAGPGGAPVSRQEGHHLGLPFDLTLTSSPGLKHVLLSRCSCPHLPPSRELKTMVDSLKRGLKCRFSLSWSWPRLMANLQGGVAGEQLGTGDFG